jgi:hypothetical protein
VANFGRCKSVTPNTAARGSSFRESICESEGANSDTDSFTEGATSVVCRCFTHAIPPSVPVTSPAITTRARAFELSVIARRIEPTVLRHAENRLGEIGCTGCALAVALSSKRGGGKLNSGSSTAGIEPFQSLFILFLPDLPCRLVQQFGTQMLAIRSWRQTCIHTTGLQTYAKYL